jgi:hypothetical protein
MISNSNALISSSSQLNSNSKIVNVYEYFANDIRVFHWPKEKFGNREIKSLDEYFYFLRVTPTSAQSPIIEVKLIEVERERNPKRIIDLTKNLNCIHSFAMTHQDYLQLPNMVNQIAKMKNDMHERETFYMNHCTGPVKENKIVKFLLEYTPEFFNELYSVATKKNQNQNQNNSSLISINYTSCFNFEKIIESSISNIKEHLFNFYKLYPKMISDEKFRDDYLRTHNFYAVYPILFEFSQLIRNGMKADEEILKLNYKYNHKMLIFLASLCQS